jgi:hypothetical protein
MGKTRKPVSLETRTKMSVSRMGHPRTNFNRSFWKSFFQTMMIKRAIAGIKQEFPE